MWGLFRGVKEHRRQPSVSVAVEPLEGRQLLAVGADASLGALELLDADRVRITYGISSSAVEQNWTVELYRSSDERFDSGDSLVGVWTVGGSQVGLLSGGLATNSRSVESTLDKPFTIEPRKPFVLAVIDPLNQVVETNEANNVAAVRRHSVVVVTHGGFQEENEGRVPPWDNRFGKALDAQGYDDVMLYNWVGESKIAGAAMKQPGRLVDRLKQRLAEIPAGEPVDLHFIGHSQGTVINGIALSMLEREPLAPMRGGVIKATLLDPHAADNGATLKQYSEKENLAGWVVKLLVNDYQGRANDPAPRVPGNVDSAEVYYQHTHISLAPQDDQAWINLWGQVPVRGEGSGRVKYHNLTGIGISHSGPYGVLNWYKENVLPSLGDGQVGVPSPILSAGLNSRTGQVLEVRPAWGHLPETYSMKTEVAAPRFEGRSWPGGTVRLTAAPVGQTMDRPITLGMATVDTDGRWSIESRELPNGRYTVIASAVASTSAAHPRVKLTPRIRVGQLTVAAADGTV